MFKSCWLSVVLGAILIVPRVGAETVRVPFGADSGDKRWEYVIALLQRTLEKTAATPGQDQIVRGAYRIQARRLVELENGEQDVAVVVPDDRLAKAKVAFIPVPLQKGLHGWRLFLVNPAGKERLAKVRTLDELRAVPMGYHPGWGDLPILQQAGFRFLQAHDYSTLLRMLHEGRFACISRSVAEIYAEVDAAHAKGYPEVEVAKNLALFYPTDFFFVVSPHRPQLARRIERGLQLMQQSGEFDRLFEQHFSASLRRADLPHRRVFQLANPFLPPSVPPPPGRGWWAP